MKVLFVNTSDTNGGAARAAYRIMQSVIREGVDAEMFVKQKSSLDDRVRSLPEFLPSNPLYSAVDWIANKSKNKIQHARWRTYKNTQDMSYKSDLRGSYLGGALQKLDYDVLHLHWINQRFVRLQDLPTNKPIVWTLHDSWTFCGVCHYFLDCDGFQSECGCCPELGSSKPNDLSHQVWKRKKEILDRLDLHIVCPSQWLAECARKSSILQGRDIRVIPNPIDTDVFRPIEQEKQSLLPVILFGAMNATKDKRKGFSHLLQALQILDEEEYETELVVFGAEKAELHLQFKHIRVRFEGYVNDTEKLVRLYNEADVMVVPSVSEVFGQTASEAMACGTPVVAFGCSGIQEVVEKSGYLAKPFDEKELANGIKECIRNSVDWGKSARKKVEEKYTMQVVAEQYERLYFEVSYDREKK